MMREFKRRVEAEGRHVGMPRTLNRSVVDAPVVPDVVPRWISEGRSHAPDERWQVILWNDDHNTIDHVVAVLMRSIDEITGVPAALRLTMAAHQYGKVSVAVCHQEKAERYRDRLEGYGLTATLEKAE
jgi:ATP-dependent Clp protease adaptor protein ClpS